MSDRGTDAVVVAALQRARDIILVARRDAETDDVDSRSWHLRVVIAVSMPGLTVAIFSASASATDI